MNVVLPVNGTSIDEAEEIISKSSLVMTVAPKKVVDATAPLHNMSDFEISIILWIVSSPCHFTGLA